MKIPKGRPIKKIKEMGRIIKKNKGPRVLSKPPKKWERIAVELR